MGEATEVAIKPLAINQIERSTRLASERSVAREVRL
jgi:hypothetical protein